VALKYNPLPDALKGKLIALVDDSIVRGNTSGPIVALLRHAGAAEIHMRVASPPITDPCFMGVDMATREELIAANKSVDEIAATIGADSLKYLSLEGMEEAIGRPMRGHCAACFSGDYPLDLDEDVGKYALEG
jgi:amidophosphoribosyltransferase